MNLPEQQLCEFFPWELPTCSAHRGLNGTSFGAANVGGDSHFCTHLSMQHIRKHLLSIHMNNTSCTKGYNVQVNRVHGHKPCACMHACIHRVAPYTNACCTYIHTYIHTHTHVLQCITYTHEPTSCNNGNQRCAAIRVPTSTTNTPIARQDQLA